MHRQIMMLGSNAFFFIIRDSPLPNPHHLTVSHNKKTKKHCTWQLKSEFDKISYFYSDTIKLKKKKNLSRKKKTYKKRPVCLLVLLLMPPNGPQSEMAFEIKFAVLQFHNLLFMLICLHLQGQRTWQHWTWDPGRKSNTKIQEMKPGVNHIRHIKAGLFLKQGEGSKCLREYPIVNMTDAWRKELVSFPGPEERQPRCEGQLTRLSVGANLGLSQPTHPFHYGGLKKCLKKFIPSGS